MHLRCKLCNGYGKAVNHVKRQFVTCPSCSGTGVSEVKRDDETVQRLYNLIQQYQDECACRVMSAYPRKCEKCLKAQELLDTMYR